MKTELLSIGIVLLSFLPSRTHLQSRLMWGDQGNGTYINPILDADYSDPDVIRVGNKYYMVASDFHFIGMQVLESDDMVNWHLISQVYDSFNYPGWDNNKHFGGGSWAPSIRYHDGKYWVFFCTYEEGLMMSNAIDPHGPWSPLHCLKAIPRWEDPCPFWDDDGIAYLGRSRWKAGPIIIHKMSADGRTLLDEGVTVYTGPVAEGTKFLKKDGFYYLIIPEGGVGEGWQTVLRSKNIYGPYEKKIVMEQGMTDINGPHQGALVSTPDGQWWFFHFQSTVPNGRVVHLQPASWKDGWPVIGVDQDMNGIGEPVRVWTKPNINIPSEVQLPATNDEFNNNTKESHWVGQHKTTLGLQWQWNHNPANKNWNLTEKQGWLFLHALNADTLKNSRNMLTQKVMGQESVAVTQMGCTKITENCFGGLLCTADRFFGIGVTKRNGKLYIYMDRNGKKEYKETIRTNTIYLKVTVNSTTNNHQFSFSTDGKRFVNVGESFSLRPGGWKGSRVGLYCYNTVNDSGAVGFNWFHYDILR